MISDTVAGLVRDIYAGTRNREIQDKLRDDPEEVLIELLKKIKDDLPNVSATLAFTVEMGSAGVLDSVKKMRAETARKERSKK